ncbi:hypothetical protein QVD17_01706 [Tagetes erecta]|uniref:Uncharacterized protein n=1 Tax=Tagetes erecta TaxID=13708 RepID=A0AAD8P734_TARER|nr:hypothetical protein QVD17_01706 [Tagetes erecta]
MSWVIHDNQPGTVFAIYGNRDKSIPPWVVEHLMQNQGLLVSILHKYSLCRFYMRIEILSNCRVDPRVNRVMC